MADAVRWDRSIILESRLRFPEPSRRYSQSPHGLDESQVAAEVTEAEQVARTWRRGQEELVFLRSQLPDGYVANGHRSFTVWKGDLVVQVMGRFEVRADA